MSKTKCVLVRVWMGQAGEVKSEVYGPFGSYEKATYAHRRLRATTRDVLRIQPLFKLPEEDA